MMRIGYFLSSEEWGPKELVAQAQQAQAAGFDRLWISDHYHPWTDAQGHSPFVWATIGALAQAVPGMHVTTAVTCPTVRIHPAVIAQAAATAAVLLDGRFTLGVGTGEALNEHIFGGRWPEADERREMLEEAVEIIRLLWQGGVQSHRGRHYNVSHARVYDLPQTTPRIVVSGFGPQAIELAARIGEEGNAPQEARAEAHVSACRPPSRPHAACMRRCRMHTCHPECVRTTVDYGTPGRPVPPSRGGSPTWRRRTCYCHGLN